MTTTKEKSFQPLLDYLEARTSHRGEAHQIAYDYAKQLAAQHTALLAVADAAKQLVRSLDHSGRDEDGNLSDDDSRLIKSTIKILNSIKG